MKLNKYKLKISIDTSEAGQWTVNLVLHRPDNKQDIQFVFHAYNIGISLHGSSHSGRWSDVKLYGDHNVSIPFESEEEVACSFLIEWTPRQCPLGKPLRSS